MSQSFLLLPHNISGDITVVGRAGARRSAVVQLFYLAAAQDGRKHDSRMPSWCSALHVTRTFRIVQAFKGRRDVAEFNGAPRACAALL